MRGLHWDKNGLKHGAWSPEEDELLISYIRRYKIWNWSQMPKFAGLSRSGKSCRLRWMNYLRPDLKHGNITEEEEEIIVNMYAQIGSRWSKIAATLPGRTDNEIKNYWHTNLKNTNKNRGVSRSRKQKKTETRISEIAETNIVGSNESDNTSVTASEGSNESNVTSITASEGSNSEGSSRLRNIACSTYMPIADSSSSTTFTLQPWTDEEPENIYVFNSNDQWFNLLLQSNLDGAS